MPTRENYKTSPLWAHIKSKEDYEDIITHLDSLQYHLDIIRFRSTTVVEAQACEEMEKGIISYRKAITRKL